MAPLNPLKYFRPHNTQSTERIELMADPHVKDDSDTEKHGLKTKTYEIDAGGVSRETDTENRGLDAKTYEISAHEAIGRPSEQLLPHRPKERFHRGWRLAALNGALSASVVFVINLAATIWALTRGGEANNVLFQGDCDRANQMNKGLHVLINVLSTILLGSSNYCMQLLSAPTRAEIDKAHSRGRWLDIGVLSVRNLMSISKLRSILWALLAFSSLPLHLFYNSAVFGSTSSNDYYVLPVTEAFLESPDCINCDSVSQMQMGLIDTYKGNVALGHYGPFLREMHAKARNGTFTRLSNADCLAEYSKTIQPRWRNLIVVADIDYAPNRPKNASWEYDNRTASAVGSFSAVDGADHTAALHAYSWICSNIPHVKPTERWGHDSGGDKCSDYIDEIRDAPEDWTLASHPEGVQVQFYPDEPVYIDFTYKVKYCLSEEAGASCKVQFVPGILILVTILNFLKAALIYFVALWLKDEPLLTMGDAVASFLEVEDPTTKGMCLLSAQDLRPQRRGMIRSVTTMLQKRSSKGAGYFPRGAKQWTGQTYRWKDVSSRTRRVVICIIFAIIVIAVSALLGYGVSELPDGQSRSLSSLADLGFGAVDSRTIVGFANWYRPTIFEAVLLANVAQTVLSLMYFAYNGLFTAMLMGYEWASYAHKRKGLRLSRTPEGEQRSTYFLQLPYRFALPLMVLSGVLHWLVSQSIFLAAIDAYGYDGNEHLSLTTIGYSPLAIITVLVVGVLMAAAMIGFGFVPLKPGMVLAGSCSAAISAACHVQGWEHTDGWIAAKEKLQWGCVGVNDEGVGHCTFTTGEVVDLQRGKMYAG